MSEMESELAKATAAKAAGTAPPTELPEGVAPVAEAGAEPAEPGTQEEGAAAEFVPEQVTLNGKIFKDTKEAYAYAEKELQKAAEKELLSTAREEGMREGMQYGIPPAAEVPQALPPTQEEFDQDFYDNPQRYLKNMREGLKEELRAENRTHQDEVQLWNEFFIANPDLAEDKTIIEKVIIPEHMQTIKVLASKNKQDAYKFMALKTRELFQRHVQAAKPQTELSNPETTQSPGNSQETSVTPQKSEEEVLSMTEQMRSLRRKKY